MSQVFNVSRNRFKPSSTNCTPNATTLAIMLIAKRLSFPTSQTIPVNTCRVSASSSFLPPHEGETANLVYPPTTLPLPFLLCGSPMTIKQRAKYPNKKTYNILAIPCTPLYTVVSY